MWLVSGGFQNTSAVELPGEFSVRGGIVDIFAPDWYDPVRVEFFGDQVDSIRRFEVSGQRSLAKLDEEKGLNLLLDHNWQDAETVFRKTLEHNTDSSTARLGLAKALLAQNHPRDALDELDAVVSGKEMSQVKILRPYAETLANLHDGNLLIIKELDAVLVNSMKLAGQGKFSIALDGLLDILRMDKNYQDGLVRGIVLAILELKGSEDPETREYRSELAAILF